MGRTRRAALTTLLLLGCPLSATAGETIWAQYLGADLKPTRAWTAAAGGEVVSLVTLPDGGMAAVVQPASGPPVLAGWSLAGTAQPVRPLAVDGPVKAAERSADGTWLVLTGRELARCGADGKVVTRRAIPPGASQEGAIAVAVAATGAWLAWPDRLSYLPLEGAERSWKLPFQEPPLETCRKEFKHPEECRYEVRLSDLQPVGGDRCLVSESLVIHHNASGPRTTRQAALTLVESTGKVAARRLVGEVSSSLQWFNFDHSAGNFSGLPGPFTLVRRSYQGSTELWLAAARGGDLLMVFMSGTRRWIERVGPSLERRWEQSVDTMGGAAISPAWTKEILYFAGAAELNAFAEDGKPLADGSLFYYYDSASGPPPPPPTVQLRDVDRRELRNAIGQTPAGEWLLVSY